MSTVRMCDRCGRIFSENESGWQTYRATTVKRDPEKGTTYQVEVAMDACEQCSLNPTVEVKRPNLGPAPVALAPAKDASGS